MADGTFGAGRWEWSIESAVTFGGEEISADEVPERLDEIDDLFYKVTDTYTHEDFYRHVYGEWEPDDLGAVAESIADQESDYFSVT